MKKIFTTLLCVLIPSLGSFSASAQSNLTSEQKKLIQEEVLPAVFKQVNQQFGLDISSLMQPEKLFENVLKSSLVTPQEADWTHTPMNIRPDSVVVLSSKSEKIKLTFKKYNTLELPTIDRYPVSLELPEEIKVSGISQLDGIGGLTLNLTPVEPTADIISGVKISVQVSILTIEVAKVTFEKLPTANAVTDYLEGFRLIVDLGGLRSNLSGTLGTIISQYVGEIEIPSDVNIVVSPDLAAGVINASLYAIPAQAPDIKVPQGDAVVALNMFPSLSVRSITLTSYDDRGTVEGWRRLWPTLEQVDKEDLVLTVDDYKFTSAEMTDSLYDGSTIWTMSDYSNNPQILKTTTSAIRYALQSALDQQQGTPVFYRLVVEDVDENKHKEVEMTTDVSAYMSGENAIGELIMQEFEGGVGTKKTIIRATASTNSESIVVDVLPISPLLEGGLPVASVYYTTNALSVLENETASALPDVTLLTAENGLYITNAEGALYSIVTMGGMKIVSGVVSGNYIQTPLSKGIYILTVTVNGKDQVFKFAR